MLYIEKVFLHSYNSLSGYWQRNWKLSPLKCSGSKPILWIKEDRKRKEKVKGQSFFEVSLSEHTLWNQTLRVLEKNLHFLSERDIYDWTMWEYPAWSLETSVSIGLNWNQMLNVTCVSFVYCIHISCMNIPCMYIEAAHHDIGHLTAQSSLTLLKLLLC